MPKASRDRPLRTFGKNMKHKLVILLFLFPAIAIGAFAYRPMPTKPDFHEMADYYQEFYDTGSIFPSRLPKEKFAEALIAGKFESSTPDVAYRNKGFPYDEALARYNGVVTLKDGTLYIWKIPRKGIIEIQDSKNQTGFIFYPQELLDLSPR
jgi:hypothetical protein